MEKLRENDRQPADGAGRIQAIVQQTGCRRAAAEGPQVGVRRLQVDDRDAAASVDQCENGKRSAGRKQTADETESGVHREYLQK